MIINCHSSLFNHCKKRKRPNVKGVAKLRELYTLRCTVTISTNARRNTSEINVFGLNEVTCFMLCRTEGPY